MDFRSKFTEWFSKATNEEASKVLGMEVKNVAMLRKGNSKAMEALFNYYDKIFHPQVMEKVTQQFLEGPKAEKPKQEEEDERTEEEKFAQWLKQSGSEISQTSLDAMRDVFFNWEGQQIAVLFPAYKTTNPITAAVLVGLALDLGKDKMRVHIEMGDAMVCNTRNRLAHQFLNDTQCEWSLWIDDDIIPPFGRSWFLREKASLGTDFPEEPLRRHVVDRLLAAKKTIVGGCYWSRQHQGVPMFGEGTTENGYTAAREMHNSVRPTQWVATGCLLVHRSVYTDIMKKFPELSAGEKIVKTIGADGQEEEIKYNREHFAFFSQVEGRGEDVTFSLRAKASGHQPHVDTGLPCLHVGYCAWGPHNTMDRRKRS